MNRGETMAEIAEGLALPGDLGQEWATHGYYGTYSHNAKAIYQYYLGWYDAVPANLNPHPPVERAKKLVEALGGAERVLALAENAMAAGDYRWSSDLLQNLVFAEPDNAMARARLAESYEQQGYQSESAIWRNQFLAAASDLRRGQAQRSAAQSNDLITALATQELLDSAATRFAPERFGNRRLTIGIDLTDRKEQAMIEASGRALIGRVGALPETADVTIRGPRLALLALLFLKQPVTAMQGAGLKVEGDAAALQALVDALDPMPQGFAIVEP
jgi:alkyl sulfatase BDS1-like metallo-beta-lactamase superfamily hydrolase